MRDKLKGMRQISQQSLEVCRNNPLAAMLAERFPYLLLLVTSLVGCSLLVVMALVASQLHEPARLWFADNHWVVGLPTAFTGALGIVLALELWWMYRHQISPEMFNLSCPVEPQEEPPLLELDVVDDPLHDHLLRLRQEGYRMIRELQQVSTFLTNPFPGQERRSDTEVRRSYEVLVSGLADMLLVAMRGLEEKLAITPRENRAGFRQAEETLTVLKKLRVIIDSRCREVHSHSRPRPCKRPANRHTESRSTRAKEGPKKL